MARLRRRETAARRQLVARRNAAASLGLQKCHASHLDFTA